MIFRVYDFRGGRGVFFFIFVINIEKNRLFYLSRILLGDFVVYVCRGLGRGRKDFFVKVINRIGKDDSE